MAHIGCFSYSGVGHVSPMLSLAQAVEDVLYDGRYRNAARRFQREIGERKGLDRAADIVEEVLRTGRPVIR